MRKIRMRLRWLWRREQLDRDLEDELAFHQAMQAEETGDAAAARRQFGNAAALRDSCRDFWLFATLESWRQDCRYALRTLRHDPTVTWVAVLALALGIGANATIFAVVKSALSFHMGVDRIDRLVIVTPGEGIRGNFLQTLPDLLALRSQVHSIDHWAAYRFQQVNVSDRWSLPERFACVQMTAGGWSLITQRPVLGRAFNTGDELPDAPATLLLSHKIWQSRYGGDPGVLGKAVRVDGVERTVIGVMPPGIQFPEDADIWTPLTPLTPLDVAGRPNAGNLLIFGRLADGVSLTAANGEIDGIARGLASLNGERARGPVAHVQLFLELIGVYESRSILMALVVAVGFVLLIVCADVANLLLARAASRSREISIRIAIGAGRARIVRQLLVESLLLAVAGGCGGWAVAVAGLRWFDWFSSRGGHRPSWIDFSMNPQAFAYLAAISIAAGVLFGLAPALQLARIDVNGAIKNGGLGQGGSMGGRRLSGVLVAFQMALCVVLLAGAGLMIHSSVNLYRAPLAVNPAGVLTMRVSLPEASYPAREDQAAFFRRLQTGLESLPGVKAVSLASNLPLAGSMRFAGECAGAAAGAPAQSVNAGALTVGPDYFRILDVRLRHGRSFTAADDATSAVVNESFAGRCWPGEDPVGKRVRRVTTGQAEAWMTVVGLVPDVHQDPRDPLRRDPLIYLPYTGAQGGSMFVMAATAVPPARLVTAFRKQVQALDKDLPAQEVTPLEERIEGQRLNMTSFGMLFTVFAAIALLLASVGLYAVMAHAVGRRTQEIGIRIAVGAGRRQIFGLVLRQGLRQVAYGLLVGLPLALAVTRGLRKILIGVSAVDPVTFAGVVLILLAAGVLGCAIPATRAVRVEPLSALRIE